MEAIAAQRSSQRGSLLRRVGVTCAVFVSAVILWGGYDHHWHWTGLGSSVTLWDWLELLVLPLAVATFPVWRELSDGLTRRHKLGAGVGVAVFATVVVGGYSFGWKWTGFQGNTLFDWLELLAAPIALPLLLAPAVKTWVTAGLPEEDPDPTPIPAPSVPAEASAT